MFNPIVRLKMYRLLPNLLMKYAWLVRVKPYICEDPSSISNTTQIRGSLTYSNYTYNNYNIMFSAETCASQLRGRNLIRHTDNYESMPRTCNRASITMTTRFRRFDLSRNWFHYFAHKCERSLRISPETAADGFHRQRWIGESIVAASITVVGISFSKDSIQ